jgi:hypothetical protein
MQAASTQVIKQELRERKNNELIDLCLRLARFKKENKELLTYLLFESHDEESYIRSVQLEIDSLFASINLSQLYFAKKTLRKIIRVINKYSRYSGLKQTDVELRLYFLKKLIQSGIPVKQNKLIRNIYEAQEKKIQSTLPGLHEDIRHDISVELEKLILHSDTGLLRFLRKK